MIYITKNKSGNTDAETHMIRFLDQFAEPYRAMMLGHIFFTNDLGSFLAEAQSHKGNTSEQIKVMKKAGSLISYLDRDMLDRLTDLYVNGGDEEQVLLGDTAMFITGYRNAASYFSEATHSILKGSAFKGKENGIAKTYYMAVGLALAERLETLMRDPDAAAGLVVEAMLSPPLPCFS